MSLNPLSLYLTKFFWKTWLKKKRKAWKVFLFELKRKITQPRLYQYLLWKLTKKDKNAKTFRFKFPKNLPLTKGKFLFLLKAKKKPWWWSLSLIALVLVLIGVPSVYLGYPLLKEYKFKRFEKTARSALQNGDLQTSLLTSQAAYIINPANLSNLKILVQSAEELNHPHLMRWLKALASHPHSEKEDRSKYLQGILSWGQLSDAQNWLSEIAGSLLEKERTYLQCLIFAQNGEEGKYEAFRLASDFLEQHPFDSPLSEFIWDLSIQSQQVFFYEEAISGMKEAAKLSSPLAKEALRRLLRTKTGSVKERKEWAKKLWRSDEPSLADAILCLNASFGENKIDGSNVLQVLQQEFPELSIFDTKHRLIKLLNQVGRPESAHQLLFSQEFNSTQVKGLYLNTIGSAFAEKEPSLAEDLIINAGPSLTENEKHFFDLLLSDSQNRKVEEVYLAEIFADCSEDELDTIRLFLRFFQNPQFLIGFLEEMEQRRPRRVGLKYLLAASYQRLGDFEKLRNILLRTPIPETVSDLTGERQTCIHKSLYNIDLDTCSAWAEQAFSKDPTNQANRFALALCYLQKNEPQSAQALLAPIFRNPPPRCPTQRLIGSLTLHRNQLFDLARKWSPRDNFSLLTDAEIVLLKEIHREQP
jgi:hypothetical protein